MSFSQHADSDIVHYHQMSTRAVLGLVFGLLGALALLSPLLWVVPAFGILAAAIGLRVTGRNDIARGRTLAYVGLFLSTATLSTAVVDFYGYRWSLEKEARQVADRFFEDLAEGRIQRAHQLTVQPRYRSAAEEDLDTFYEEGSTWLDTLEKWQAPASPGVSEPSPIYSLIRLGEDARAVFIETSLNQTDSRGHVVHLAYRIDRASPSSAEQSDPDVTRPPFHVGLSLNRYHKKDGHAYWHVSWVQFLQPKDE